MTCHNDVSNFLTKCYSGWAEAGARIKSNTLMSGFICVETISSVVFR